MDDNNNSNPDNRDDYPQNQLNSND